MKHLDLFSGIGGFSLAAQIVWGKDYENIGFCENDEYLQNELRRLWPKARIYGDIRGLTGGGTTDLITGGFPCQPFSIAGKRRSTEDDRHLWPEMFRVIKERKPTWVVGENVANFIELALEETFSDLEGIGYEVQSLVIPACAVDAPHRRDRVWIIAYADGKRRSGVDKKQKGLRQQIDTPGFDGWFDDPDNLRLDVEGLFPLTSVCQVRNDDGLSEGMARLKGYGNAIVPGVAMEIFKAIKQIEEIWQNSDT